MNIESRLVTFAGGQVGAWAVVSIAPVAGASLASVPRLAVAEGPEPQVSAGLATWSLRGTIEPTNYVRPLEATALEAVSAPLGRSEATAAALIPIRKSSAWWGLSLEERRAIFEERSHHIARSIPYLPRIARRLHHGHDLAEPFDFLTWFEFAPADEHAFDELLALLRATEEWDYVDREVDIRLRRD